LVPTAFRENIAALNKEEPTGYAELVAYGVVFGHAGKWHVAALLAARAISIAENIQRSRKRGDHPIASTKISGREAYYLRAGCLRFKARSEQDLAGIEQLLENADRAYMSDRAGNPGLPDTSYRFAAERLSFRLNRCLMKLLSPEGNNSRDIEEACLIVSDLDVMAQRLKEAQVSWVQRIVERNALTNIYMMHAAVELVAGKSSQEIEKVGKRHIAAFLENLALDEKLKDGGFPKTWLVSAVSWHAISRFGEPDRKTRASFRDEIGRLEHLLREEPDTLIVAPYDNRRFEILATLGKRHFGVS
jgi:hypothetical protein